MRPFSSRPFALPKVVSRGHCQLTVFLSLRGLDGNNAPFSGGLVRLWAYSRAGCPKFKWVIVLVGLWFPQTVQAMWCETLSFDGCICITIYTQTIHTKQQNGGLRPLCLVSSHIWPLISWVSLGKLLTLSSWVSVPSVQTSLSLRYILVQIFLNSVIARYYITLFNNELKSIFFE